MARQIKNLGKTIAWRLSGCYRHRTSRASRRNVVHFYFPVFLFMFPPDCWYVWRYGCGSSIRPSRNVVFEIVFAFCCFSYPLCSNCDGTLSRKLRVRQLRIWVCLFFPPLFFTLFVYTHDSRKQLVTISWKMKLVVSYRAG